MKIKKFNNLWQMGLIIFGGILGVLYLLKLIFPSFVVGIAQIDAIVKFGNYVQNHLWAYYIFVFMTTFFVFYFLTCASCRKKNLSLLQICIISINIVCLLLIQKYLPTYYFSANEFSMFIVPAICCLIDKKKDIKYFYSTIICCTINSLAQIFSLLIRDIGTMIAFPNIVSYTILLLDAYIWLVLLYNYFNYKEV